MKCNNCGYISSRDFYRCPYCGHVHPEEGDVLKTRLIFGAGFSVRIRTILYGFLVNLFAASVLVDWFLNFQYSITLWSFIICFGGILFLSIFFNKKTSIYTLVEKIDFYFLLCLLLASGLCRIQGVFDVRVYIIGIALPAYLLATVFLAFCLIVFGKRTTMLRPLVTDLLMVFHALIATLLFVFLLVNKYSVAAGVAKPAFDWMQLGMTKDSLTTLYIVEEVLVFASFGASWASLVNYNIFLVGFIYRKVQNIYGGGSGD